MNRGFVVYKSNYSYRELCGFGSEYGPLDAIEGHGRKLVEAVRLRSELQKTLRYLGDILPWI